MPVFILSVRVNAQAGKCRIIRCYRCSLESFGAKGVALVYIVTLVWPLPRVTLLELIKSANKKPQVRNNRDETHPLKTNMQQLLGLRGSSLEVIARVARRGKLFPKR
jgi:hypothetical protein